MRENVGIRTILSQALRTEVLISDINTRARGDRLRRRHPATNLPNLRVTTYSNAVRLLGPHPNSP